MKLQKIIFVIMLSLNSLSSLAQDLQAIAEQVVTVVKTPCACGPTEHWFYKVCVKNYVAQYPDAGFIVSDDSEGLSDNLVQAIEMLAADIQFVDSDNNVIVPTVSAKGNLLLPMSKNVAYKLAKAILHQVDTTTTLSAQELYVVWIQQLQAMKAVQ